MAYLLDKEAEFQSTNKWPYATLANCFFGLGDKDNGLKYEKVYLGLVGAEWEKKTYFESKDIIIKLIEE